jgi:predicted RNase H-like nuclease
VDGCPAGWICITRDLAAGRIGSACYSTAAELIAQQPRPAVLAVDMPIGLPDAGWRACDRLARDLLGRARRSSVFPAPIRPALHARTLSEAGDFTERVDGRRVSAQSFGIYRKVRELDAILAADVTLQSWVVEVHPELSFRAWDGGQPMRHNKKTSPGRTERRALIDAHFGAGAIAAVRAAHRARDVGHDDIHDAFAALWTAERILAGSARVIPDDPPLDTVGLRMEMWY